MSVIPVLLRCGYEESATTLATNGNSPEAFASGLTDLCEWRESVTDIFLVKNSAPPPRSPPLVPAFDSPTRLPIKTSSRGFYWLLVRVAGIEPALSACPVKYRARSAIIFYEDPVARSGVSFSECGRRESDPRLMLGKHPSYR